MGELKTTYIITGGINLREFQRLNMVQAFCKFDVHGLERLTPTAPRSESIDHDIFVHILSYLVIVFPN